MKSIDQINEMVKKNELKIKTSNKRLFSDVSAFNTKSFDSTNAPTTGASKNEEMDFKFKRFNSLKTNPIVNNTTTLISGNNFLNKIVGLKPSPVNPSLNAVNTTKTTASNLISMVVSNTNPTSMIGSFAKKLQDIQSERNVSTK